MAKAMQDAFNQQLGWLDNTMQPQTQQAWYNYLQQNQNVANQLSGLSSPSSVASANQGFDSGVADYEKKAGDMYTNAGYTPQEQQGQRVATAAGFAAPYAQAANQMKLQQQRTGNSAGVNASIGGMAREKGRMVSAGLGGLEKGFGDARIQGQQQAMSLSQFPQMARLQRMQTEQQTAGLGLQAAGQNQSAYGTGIQGQLGATGIRSSNINANPGFLKTLGQGLAGSLGNIGLAFGGG
jgi:hypothetical protein